MYGNELVIINSTWHPLYRSCVYTYEKLTFMYTTLALLNETVLLTI